MIDQQLLQAYAAELEALRDHGREFAAAFPDVAGRLDISAMQSRDPHVERIIESTAFLAARLRLMIEEGAVEVPQTMLALVAPALAEPIPSMTVLHVRDGNESQFLRRGSRFDYEAGNQALSCFSTTMDLHAHPISLRLRRLSPSPGAPDGIGVRVLGTPSGDRLLLFVGSNRVNAATLLDALDDDLAWIRVVPPDGGNPAYVPTTNLRLQGFGTSEAALPVRPAVHRAHRVVTEFLVFPDKFRFVSLAGLPLRSGCEVQFGFSRPLQLPESASSDLFRANHVPAVNLWKASADPINITGRQLEYPVRVDALRYRSTECHSVESVDLIRPRGDPERIDPVVAYGNTRGTSIRWAVRREISRGIGRVLLLFQGLDFGLLGREQYLAAPSVLANNRDLAPRVAAGQRLQPVAAVGDWRCSVAIAPTAYRRPETAGSEMESLLGYLQSGMTSLAERPAHLKDFLSRFPAAGEATWIKGIGGASVRPVATVRFGNPQPATEVGLTFDQRSHRETSGSVLKRVLALLFESQRGINRVQNVTVTKL